MTFTPECLAMQFDISFTNWQCIVTFAYDNDYPAMSRFGICQLLKTIAKTYRMTSSRNDNNAGTSLLPRSSCCPVQIAVQTNLRKTERGRHADDSCGKLNKAVAQMIAPQSNHRQEVTTSHHSTTLNHLMQCSTFIANTI